MTSSNDDKTLLERAAREGFKAFWAFHVKLGFLQLLQENTTHFWHVTTLLNTFNTYHCYDAHLGYARAIEPVFMRVALTPGAARRECRLVGVEIVRVTTTDTSGAAREVDENAITLQFEDDERIFTMSLREFDAANSGHNDETMSRRTHYPRSRGAAAVPRYVKYSNNDEWATELMSPVLTDVRVRAINDTGTVAIVTRVKEPDDYWPDTLAQANPVWHVNLLYVAPWRLSVEPFAAMAEFPPSFYYSHVTQEPDALQYLNDYLYGADWSYVEENFNTSTGVYVAQTTIRYSAYIESYLKDNFIKHGFVYRHKAPSQSQLPVHVPDTYTQWLEEKVREYSLTIRVETQGITPVLSQLASLIEQLTPTPSRIASSVPRRRMRPTESIRELPQQQQTGHFTLTTRDDDENDIQDYDTTVVIDTEEAPKELYVELELIVTQQADTIERLRAVIEQITVQVDQMTRRRLMDK